MPACSASSRVGCLVLLASVMTAPVGVSAQAKGGAGSSTGAGAGRTVPTQPSGPPIPTSTTWPDALELRERENLELAREERLKAYFRRENQKRVERDTQKLVELTAAYQHAVLAHSSTDEANQKMLREIEKLANGIRQRMLGLSS